ncbi:helix-turn-helix transcriptional regulator [Deminuibacter soli]|uniref:AraC family transcriptional regulator n=1 Tax=Deminuibacter soli TaxID=2291815 RepID=A0A3E1NLU5_9BACT|nr:helix-turn-helix transcriptional regulator [Deminuibacter soli]RFM28905.1 AraC family transcriptional regulator [Deminuibacter soli]
MEIAFNKGSYIDLQNLLDNLKDDVIFDRIQLQPEQGKGFICALNMGDGMCALLADVTCKQDILFKQLTGGGQFYIFQFNESMGGRIHFDNEPIQHEQVYNMQQNVVLLTNSQMPASYIIQSGIHIRTIKIILEKKHLLQYLDSETVEAFLSTYFSQWVKTGNVEPIDVEYRKLIDSILKYKYDHPLTYTFAINRCMLLLERFITRFMKRARIKKPSLRIKDDDITRLMRVEALLIKSYIDPPPTINVLAKEAAMSPTKLKKDFKELYGVPIYEYFQMNRMNYARTLMQEGRYAIKEVGKMVGYTNLSHFAGSFKKEFGVLPSEFNARDEALQVVRY